MNSIRIILAITLTLALSSGCGGDPSFSLTSESSSFTQVATQSAKVDVLWVIDNSGSMAGAQSNLTSNFTFFMNKFTEKNLNFQIAVAGSDAYQGLPFYAARLQYDQDKLHFRDGDGVTNSNVFVVNNSTTDPVATFVTNALLGVGGSGDERIFQSMEGALDDSFNSGFIRSDSFLAVIILSDENDLSHDGTSAYNSGSDTLHTIASYKSYLDSATNSTVDEQKYSVSTISILNLDTTCLNDQKAVFNSTQTFGTRYEELVDATSPRPAKAASRKISLCSDFGVSLGDLAQTIVDDTLVTEFEIDREPVVSTITVNVNGSNVAQSIAGSAGWLYEERDNRHYINFTSNDLVPASSSISINYDPAQFDN